MLAQSWFWIRLIHLYGLKPFKNLKQGDKVIWNTSQGNTGTVEKKPTKITVTWRDIKRND